MAFNNAFKLGYTRYKMTNNKGFVAGSKIHILVQKYYLGRVDFYTNIFRQSFG